MLEPAQLIKDKLTDVLAHLGEEYSFSLTEEENEGRKYIFVNIEGENVSVLIGYHGQTLKSLQQWLSVVVSRQYAATGQENTCTVIVDIGNYRADQDEKIVKRAQEAIEQVQFLQDDYVMPPMSARHRRLVHMEVAKNSMVESHSEGEGRDRHVVISLKGLTDSEAGDS